jgi:hypothetical protein
MELQARTDQNKAIMEELWVILDYYLIFLLHVQYIHISAEKYHYVHGFANTPGIMSVVCTVFLTEACHLGKKYEEEEEKKNRRM